MWLRVVVFALCGLGVRAEEKPAVRESTAHDYLVRMREQAGAPGMSAAVSVGGKIVFAEGAGVADLASGAAQTARTVHNIGSVSKVETAVAVMQLVEQGKVELDAEIQRYAPWFPRKERPITLRQILTHTSGIRHYKPKELVRSNAAVLRHYDTFEESTRFWREDALLFAPGTQFSYSSFAVNLLQAVIESASGETFEGYMRAHVWGPAEMRDSQFDVAARVVANRGKAYVRRDKGGQFENALDEDVSYKYASGGMLASDEDLCRFGHALNSGVLLKPATLAEMYRLQLAPSVTRFGGSGPGTLAPSTVQGLAFRVSKDARGHMHAGHSGSVKGAMSQFFNYYKDDITVAVYMNFDSDEVALTEIAEKLAGLFDAATPAAETGGKEAAVDALFAAMKPGAPGAVVAVYQGGRTALLRSYGSANLELNVPMTPQAVFNLASVSKQFTGFAIALLVREGKIDLQADIRTYLPEMPKYAQPITVADLVHHVSGIRDYITLGSFNGHDDEGVLLQADAVALLQRQRALNFEPGTEFEYSNAGYALLAEIVAKVSGKSFREFLQERIFGPMEMHDTRVHDDLAQLEPGYVTGYRKTENGWKKGLYNRATIGPGNVLSTAPDLLKWLRGLMHPPAGYEALASQLVATTALKDGTPIHYGFGLGAATIAGHRALTHNGGVSGYNAAVAFFPEDDFAFVVLANQQLELAEMKEKLTRIFLPAAAGQAAAEAPSEPEPAALGGLPGSYASAYGPVVTLALGKEGRGLTAQMVNGDPERLKFWKDGTFGAADDPETRYRAVRDAVGKVSALEELAAGDSPARVTQRLGRIDTAHAEAALAGLSGDFYSDEVDATYRVTVESGHAMLRSLWLRKPQMLAPTAADRLETVSGPIDDLNVSIERNGAGEVTGLIFHSFGVRALHFARVLGR